MNDAIIHFANAAVVCTQKSYFLDAMQKSLPAPLFQLLYQQYRITNEVRINHSLGELYSHYILLLHSVTLNVCWRCKVWPQRAKWMDLLLLP